MPDTQQARNDWIRKVLGVTITGPSTGASYGTSAATDAPDAAAFARLRAALEPKLTAALRAAPEEQGALSAAWAAIDQYEKAGDLTRALAAAMRLQEKVETVTANAAPGQAERLGIPTGLVTQRRAELEAMLHEQAEAAKELTASTIGSFTGELDDVVEQPEALVAAMTRYVDDLLARITDDLGAALIKGDTSEVRKRVAAWQGTVGSDQGLVAISEAAGTFGIDDPREALDAMLDGVLAGVDQLTA
jgi:hypothetical protein